MASAAALRLVARKVCPRFLTARAAVEAAGHRRLLTSSMSSSHGGSSQLIHRLISTSAESSTKAAAARVEEMKKEMLGLLRQMDRDGKHAMATERENKKLLELLSSRTTTGKTSSDDPVAVAAYFGLVAIAGGIMFKVINYLTPIRGSFEDRLN